MGTKQKASRTLIVEITTALTPRILELYRDRARNIPLSWLFTKTDEYNIEDLNTGKEIGIIINGKKVENSYYDPIELFLQNRRAIAENKFSKNVLTARIAITISGDYLRYTHLIKAKLDKPMAPPFFSDLFSEEFSNLDLGNVKWRTFDKTSFGRTENIVLDASCEIDYNDFTKALFTAPEPEEKMSSFKHVSTVKGSFSSASPNLQNITMPTVPKLPKLGGGVFGMLDSVRHEQSHALDAMMMSMGDYFGMPPKIPVKQSLDGTIEGWTPEELEVLKNLGMAQEDAKKKRGL